MYSHLTTQELIRMLLCATDLTPREVALLERLDQMQDQLYDMDEQLRGYESGKDA